MRPRSGLRQRILLGVLGYTVLLSIAVLAHGILVNERAEQLVWKTLLTSELDYFVSRSRADAAYRWSDTVALSLYDGAVPDRIPAAFRGLDPGVHDEVQVGGQEYVVLVREVDGRKLVLALDIAELEADEFSLGLTVAVSSLLLVVLLGISVAWGVRRLTGPLTNLAADIGHLRPDLSGQRVAVPDRASEELLVIAEALNGYLERHESFVARERAFIDSASHELRTPIAVIAGASELALEQRGVPPLVRGQLARILRASIDVEQLISLLLVLAKDPARLADISDRLSLDQLLPEVVEDHRHLTADKDLVLVLDDNLPACEIIAPVQIVQAAIGNLLRNAIENSDSGEIRIRLEPAATVVIEDPGHGMSPEQISAIYARMARGARRGGGGIGLDLITRLCAHLGWQLELRSDLGRGTRTTLSLQPRT